MRAICASSVSRPLGTGLSRPFGWILGFFFTIGLCHLALASKFTFNWPVPSHFTVEEVVSAKGNTVEYSYDFELNKTNDGFVLECNKVQLTSYNGQKLSEKNQTDLEPIARMSQYPPLQIDSDGSFIEVLQGEAAVERAQQGLEKTFPNLPNQTKVGLKAFYQNEAGKKALNQIYGNIWALWVEAWTDLDLKEGESMSTNLDLSTGEGEPLPTKETWTDAGWVKGKTNLVCLKFKSITHGKDLVATIKPYTDAIATNASFKPADPLPSGISFERSVIMEIHTDPNTLQPQYAREAMTIRTKPPGEDEIIDTQTHIYTFTWDKP